MSHATVQELKTIDMAPLIGTEIVIDKQSMLRGTYAREIREVLENRGAIFFRAIDLTDEQQVIFAKTIGDVIEQGEKGIFKVTMDTRKSVLAEYLRGAVHWHIDGTMDDAPTRASLLAARQLAPVGGETEFANTYASLEALPEEEQRWLETLRVVHSMEAVQSKTYPNPTPDQVAGWRKYPPKVHPLIWKHQSGRKSLVLGATVSHIEGMDRAESDALIERLTNWCTQDRFVYQHQWTLGDLLIWDNTGTMHRVLPYDFESGRMMHRTTLVAEERLA